IGKRTNYRYHAIVDEMLEILATVVEEPILEDIYSSVAIGLEVDETTDISVTRQLDLHVRFYLNVFKEAKDTSTPGNQYVTKKPASCPGCFVAKGLYGFCCTYRFVAAVYRQADVLPHLAQLSRISQKENVKTDLRSRLQGDRLAAIMLLSINGPPLTEFPYSRALELFFHKPKPNQPTLTPLGTVLFNTATGDSSSPLFSGEFTLATSEVRVWLYPGS
ncbi:hypothetical protein GOODEAATRI_021341, partial [Goodea atripinnis]